jgi:hypothetical protein
MPAQSQGLAGHSAVTCVGLHQGGFATAVGADQAVALTVAELDGDVLEQRLAAELHGDVGRGDQGRIP